MGNYDDIINLPHHTSQRHSRMSMYNRAAQFSPFAALTGYEKAIEEARERKKKKRNAAAKERRLQEAALKIKKEFGKNALLRGLNYAEGATQKERNNQIGEHKA
jgi:DNA polymerase V